MELWDDALEKIERLAKACKWLEKTYPEIYAKFKAQTELKTKNQSKEQQNSGESVIMGAEGAGDGNTTQKAFGADIVAHYCDCFKLRYGMHPKIPSATAGKLVNTFRKIGRAESKKLISAFFHMNDERFVRTRHEVGLLVLNLNTVRVFAEKGEVMTRKRSQQIESMDMNARVLSDWLNEEGPSDGESPNTG